MEKPSQPSSQVLAKHHSDAASFNWRAMLQASASGELSSNGLQWGPENDLRMEKQWKNLQNPMVHHGSAILYNIFILITMDWDYSQSLGFITYGIIFIGIFWIIQYCMIWCSFSLLSPTEHIISYYVFLVTEILNQVTNSAGRSDNKTIQRGSEPTKRGGCTATSFNHSSLGFNQQRN